MNRAVIFANGAIKDYALILPMLQPRDFVMAADGGLKHIHRLKLKPALLIGDLDSISPSDLDLAEFQKTEIIRFEKDKDETDLELAIKIAMERGYRDMLIIAGLGGRIDHTLANILLMLHPDFQRCRIKFDDGVEEVFLITDKEEIKGEVGDIVSLIPFNGDCEGVKTENLKYPLQNESLLAFKTKGISNVMISNSASVSLESGTAYCIHIRKNLWKEKT